MFLQAFQDLVETTDAVTGKPAMPLANADNVAMLQVSGTLANRWVPTEFFPVGLLVQQQKCKTREVFQHSFASIIRLHVLTSERRKPRHAFDG